MGVCNCSMFCCTLFYVNSSIAIILMGKRELIALLNLSSWCLVMVERLFLAVPRGSLQFVIVVFHDHTHYFGGLVRSTNKIKHELQPFETVTVSGLVRKERGIESAVAECSTDGTQHERNYPVTPAPMPGSPIQLLTELCVA